MRFGPRNAYYLRISEHTVLPLYVYLDERHIDWMSERVLQHVLEDLRPRILPKLRDEADAQLGPGGPANAKRGSVDVYRGDTYQFGYFLRKTDPHAVLIKTRYFVPAPDPPKEAERSKSPSPKPPPKKGKKRASKKATAPPKQSKKRKTKGKQRARESDEEDEVISISGDDGDEIEQPASGATVAPRRSARNRKLVVRGYQEQDDEQNADNAEVFDVDADDADVEMTISPATNTAAETAESNDSIPSALPLDDPGLIAMDESEDIPSVPVKHEDTEPMLSLPRPPQYTAQEQKAGSTVPPAEPVIPKDEKEENKAKLLLQLRYHGFNIHGQCLCVIVEPYPPIRAASRAPSLAPAGFGASRAPSIAPADFVPRGAAAQRAQTPLFLPDYDRGRSVTPARPLPPVPLFNETIEDSDSDDEGMMQLSQILRSVGEHQAGAVGDDDEIEGAVFFGDADENREL